MSIVVYCVTWKVIPMRLYLVQRERRSELEDPKRFLTAKREVETRKITDAMDADWVLKPEIV